MRRSRAFILSEILMTMMLQAGFILVLCTSFYMLTSFYSKTQQVLTARSHAERAISFFDDKIKNAGLGLWRCDNPSEIRAALDDLPKLKTNGTEGYRLPVALTWYKDDRKKKPEISNEQNEGDVLSLLYAQRDLSTTEEQELILFTATAQTINGDGNVKLIDSDTASRFKHKKNSQNTTSMFVLDTHKHNIENYAVAEAVGVPMFLHSISGTTLTLRTADETVIPAATELMYLKFIQIFVQEDGEGRQLAFNELKYDSSDGWDKKYNQEKNILEIYMTLDHDTNIFTLYVLAQGGYDASVNNPRPSAWPKEANPKGDDDDKAKTAWLAHDYSHYTVYVSRASWKLNNIPPNFDWSN